MKAQLFKHLGKLLFACFILTFCTLVFAPVAQDDWNGTQRAVGGGKAPTQRPAKPGFREPPYGRY